jgi:signal transduction histidine kinase
VTTLQAAAAARTLERDPDAARRSLAAIEETGRAALADLDHVLGLLRAPDAPADGRREPAPTLTPRTLDDLPSLVDEVRAAGGIVTGAGTAASSRPPGPVVPRAVSREAYRVVQEALTNVLRHAPGATADAGWTLTPDGLVVEVRNGPGTARPRPAAARGTTGERHGLAGMRERVATLGGRLTVGPTPDGGWQVRATFPLPRRGGRPEAP